MSYSSGKSSIKSAVVTPNVLAMRLRVASFISYCGFFHARLIVLNGTFASRESVDML